jgi:hypothetical protein
LVVAKRSARQARISYLIQIRHLGFTAPDQLRERFRPVPRAALAATAAALRPQAGSDPMLYATKLAMRTLGRRVLALDHDTNDLDAVLADLVAVTAPSLLEVHGVGVDTAAILLVAAGDNSERIPTEAAFAHLCGAAPTSTGSGRTNGRHRLNLGRQLPSQPRPLADRGHQDEQPPQDRRLRRASPRPRTLQARDHPLPEALQRPGDLPASPTLTIERRAWPDNCLTPSGCPSNEPPARRSPPRHRMAS